jgi:glycosyl transferase family 25
MEGRTPGDKGLAPIPVYVIHAQFMTERRASISEQLERLGVPFEFILENDPGSFDERMVATYLSPTVRIGMGARSCLLKHFAAYEKIVERRQEEALILEDDALLGPDFVERLDAVRREARTLLPLRSIQLGAANNRYTPARHLRSGQLLYPARRVRATEAYVIGWREAERYINAIAAAPTRYPIDLLMNRLNPALGIMIYWAEPPLSFQGSMTGRFRSAIEHKARHRSRIYNRIKFTAHRLGKYHLRQLWHRILPRRST